MKLKHNAGSKTDREKLAKQLAWALQNGINGDQLKQLEGININLPPGSIERAARNLGIDLKSMPLSQQPKADQDLINQKLQNFVVGGGGNSRSSGSVTDIYRMASADLAGLPYKRLKKS